MKIALEEARRAQAAGEVPVGAVVVGEENQELARAFNSPLATGDPTAHAEILAIRAAASVIGNYRLAGCSMYVTLEPCPMCAGALVHARFKRLIFGARDLRFGGVRSKFQIADSPLLNHRVENTEGVLAADATELLQALFQSRR